MVHARTLEPARSERQPDRTVNARSAYRHEASRKLNVNAEEAARDKVQEPE